MYNKVIIKGVIFMDRSEENSKGRPSKGNEKERRKRKGKVEEKIKDMLSLLARFHGIDGTDEDSTVILDIYKDGDDIFFEVSKGSLPSDETHIVGILVTGQSNCSNKKAISFEYFLLGKGGELKSVESAPLAGTTLIMGRITPSPGSEGLLEIKGYSVTFDLCGSISGYLSVRMKKANGKKNRCGRMWILIPKNVNQP